MSALAHRTRPDTTVAESLQLWACYPLTHKIIRTMFSLRTHPNSIALSVRPERFLPTKRKVTTCLTP